MSRSLIASLAAAGLLALAGSAHGAITIYDAFLSGPNESPANASPGTGFAMVTIDDVLNQMTVDVSFSDLLGNTTASHIHCCTAVADAGTARAWRPQSPPSPASRWGSPPGPTITPSI